MRGSFCPVSPEAWQDKATVTIQPLDAAVRPYDQVNGEIPYLHYRVIYEQPNNPLRSSGDRGGSGGCGVVELELWGWAGLGEVDMWRDVLPAFVRVHLCLISAAS
jgi:hypothetical protein